MIIVIPTRHSVRSYKPRHRRSDPADMYRAGHVSLECRQEDRVGDLRGLQLADHRLFITVCHRHLPTANREMNHRLSRQTRHQRPVAGRSRDPRSPAYAYLTRRLPRGTARGTAFRIVPAHPELSVLQAASPVLLVRTVNGAPEAVAPEEPRAPHLVAVHGRGPAARLGPSQRLCLTIRSVTPSMTWWACPGLNPPTASLSGDHCSRAAESGHAGGLHHRAERC